MYKSKLQKILEMFGLIASIVVRTTLAFCAVLAPLLVYVELSTSNSKPTIEQFGVLLLSVFALAWLDHTNRKD